MNPEQKRENSKEGWQEETSGRKESVLNFLKEYVSKPFDERKKYDNFVELHVSGSMKGLLDEGIEERASIKSYYQADKINKIAVSFQDNKGHYHDVHLAGKALEDYLSGDLEK